MSLHNNKTSTSTSKGSKKSKVQLSKPKVQQPKTQMSTKSGDTVAITKQGKKEQTIITIHEKPKIQENYVQPKIKKDVPKSKGNASSKPRISQSMKPARSISQIGGSSDKLWNMYDHYRASINPYLQTLLNPWQVQGCKIPQGDIPTTSFAVRQRYTFVTDATGNLFAAFGCGRALKDGTSPGAGAVVSIANAQSLVPNKFKADGTDSLDDTFSYIFGCVHVQIGSVNKNNVFSRTDIENVKLNVFNPSDTPAFLLNNSQLRLVSGGVAIQPLGELVGSKGSMTTVFVPYDTFNPNETLEDITFNDIQQMPYSTFVPMNKVTGASLMYRPTDDLNYEFIPIVNPDSSQDYTRLTENPYYSPGGLWVCIEEYEAGVEIVFDIVMNFEGIPSNLGYAPGLSDNHPDTYMLDHADQVLDGMPSSHEGTGQTEGGLTARRKLDPSDNVKIHSDVWISPSAQQSRTVKSNGTKYLLQGPTKLAGVKEIVGGIANAYTKYRPMLDKIINEWGPLAAKLAIGVAGLI